MATMTEKTKRKPLSRGQRKHVRRLKQEARRTSVPNRQLKKKTLAAETPKA